MEVYGITLIENDAKKYLLQYLLVNKICHKICHKIFNKMCDKNIMRAYFLFSKVSSKTELDYKVSSSIKLK